MSQESTTLATFYKEWEVYQGHLTKAIAPLSPDQLTLRAAPHLRSIGEIAGHMIGARGRWFHDFLGEGDAGLAALARWDARDAPVRTAAELVGGLETTWQVTRSALDRWGPADMQQTFEGRGRELSRSWVIWHLLEHDLHHGGEISLALGMHGLEAPDI